MIVRSLVCLLASLAAWPAFAASLESFSPLGLVTQVRQVQARFSEAMAAVGQSDAAAPFAIDCPGGPGYWVDERTWVFDLPVNGLPPATTCRFSPLPALKSLAGAPVEAASEYRFQSPGAALEQILPRPGSRIDEQQAFVLVFDGPTSPERVQASAHCNVQGIHERLPVRQLEGAARAAVIKAANSEGILADRPDTQLAVVQCARPLPAEARLSLTWQPADLSTSAPQAHNYTVREHFVARLRCPRESTRAGCIPLQAIRLEFSAPVARADLDRITLKDGKGKRYRQRSEITAFDTGISFPGPFPADSVLTLGLPADLHDDAGRGLVNRSRFPLAVRVGKLPPLVKFAGDFGIIERHAGSLLPITLRNLEPGVEGTEAKVRWLRLDSDAAILDWWKRLDAFDHPDTYPRPDRRRERLLTADTPGLVERALPKPNGAQAFEVVGLPLELPGYYVIEAESRRLGQALLGADQPMFVRAAALVTNLSVHFKWGPKNSLAWVTALDSGQPVPNARIAVSDCRGKQLARAVTDTHGISRIPRGLPDPRAEEYDCPLLVSARTEADLAFARSDWNKGIEPWRFNLPFDWRQEDRLAHTVFDRTLFKPGETVHMKHILRDQRLHGLGLAARQPATLMLEHLDSGQRWFMALNWRNGAALTDWTIPTTARRGSYGLRLIDKAIRPDTPPEQLEYLEGLDSGAFTVSDFRVPLMKARLNPVQPTLTARESAELDVSVSYLGGGAARQLPVKLRAMMRPRYDVAFEAWPDHEFAQAPEDQDLGDEVLLGSDPFTLDTAGTARGRLAGFPSRAYPQRIDVELEYADPNGEIQTVARRLDWWPADVVIGVKRPDWVMADRQTMLEFRVVDLAGKPVAGAPVTAHPVLRRDMSHRVRLAGGFYGYREQHQDTALPSQCEGVTDDQGRFSCTVLASEAAETGGEILVTAETRDAAGRVARTAASYWIASQDDWWFAQQNHDRIDLLSGKKNYQPGEKARFQVRMPFREATALVTVERDGMLDARVVHLSGKSPVFDLPIKADWTPNVFVSALVVRGRVGNIPPTALVDLGRPAFKLGIARINVEQRSRRLEVAVSSDREVYQTRDTARVALAVKTADGKPLPRDTEVIVAAVDEGLLELADNTSWDLLQAMMAERGYSVRTFTAQMQITGKRHFGKKALPPGGGGGRSPTRELFDTLLYWNPALKLDARGQARVEIPLNDNLTRFRIVAIAASKSRFGTGSTTLRSTRDLRIDAGLPPVVRVGDRFTAHFTLHNSTGRPMRVAVEARVSPLGALSARTLDLAPGDGQELSWPLTVPDTESLTWQLSARELLEPGSSQAAEDHLKVAQSVQPTHPIRQVAGQLYRLEQPLALSLAAPDEAIPGRGEVRATLAPSLLEGLTGVRDYMRQYPYQCLEQQVSRAAANHDGAAWSSLMEALPGYLDGNGLASYFPAMQQGSVMLTAYVLSISQLAGYPMPAASRTAMETALANYLAGRLEVMRPASDREDSTQRLAALAALARLGKATPAQAATIRPDLARWPAGLLIDWIEVLKAMPTLPERKARFEAAQAALRAHLSHTGSRIHFGDEGAWWQMRSGDTQAVRGLLAVMDLPAWRDDLPRLVAGTLARQSNGHWNTTTANALGTLALDRYSRLFETTRPTGTSTVQLGDARQQVAWSPTSKGGTLQFKLPASAQPLSVQHRGEGTPYLALATHAALELKQPKARGYTVNKALVAIEQQTPGQWRRGDLVRVRLTIEARDDMGWVVVDDPVPAGASLLGGGLKRDSALLSAGEQAEGRAWPAWQERRFDRFQAYYEYLPRGRTTLEYTLRLNNEGTFRLPPTRVEAMYAPEMFGETPNTDFTVAP